MQHRSGATGGEDLSQDKAEKRRETERMRRWEQELIRARLERRKSEIARRSPPASWEFHMPPEDHMIK